MTRSVLADALALAQRGIAVFPCDAKKRPITPHGFLSATASPAVVRQLFADPAAKLIAMPTGVVSGFDALDINSRNGGVEWEQIHGRWLPETRVHQTQSGGRHYLFKHDPRVRNSAGRIAPGIDVRGSGGYIIVPPSAGYRVVSDAPAADWPDWLLQPGLVLPPQRERPEPSRPCVPTSSRRLDAYRARVLATLATAADGQKHSRLVNAGLALGGVAAAAGFSDDDAISWLLQALPSAKDWHAAARTAAWAVAAGRHRPLQLEDRHEYQRSPPAAQQSGARPS